MFPLALCLFFITLLGIPKNVQKAPVMTLFEADNRHFQYMGRIDFSKPKTPKFWAPGVTIKAKFQGTSCEAVFNDEVAYGTSHNYIEIAVDNQKPVRIQTTGPINTINVAEGLAPGAHTVTLCKDTESGIGYVEFVGLRCEKLLALPRPPARRLEFIGDSITCGAGSDQSQKPCGVGEWYAQNNAYGSYGVHTARLLNAQWQLSSVSGIGLMHSCCDMTETMPTVFDRLKVRDGELKWDFARYQPDAVTVCLGQNDGQQEPNAFQDHYVGFLQDIRGHYPKAQIICLTSPMADDSLTAYLKTNLTQIVARRNEAGDKNVHTFFFAHHYNRGCGQHPNLDDHQLIAGELAPYLKATLGW